MSPVLRVSEELYRRLESLAIGFDTPSNVIQRLIDFYLNGENNKISIQELQDSTTSKIPITNNSKYLPSLRKVRDKSKELELRYAVGKALNRGDFRLEDNSLLIFKNPPHKVICRYSSFSSEQKRWFWGVSSKYWMNWTDTMYLALIMQKEDKINYSYLLIKPKDTIILFLKCAESAGEKKINLRIYKNDERPHIQEWKDFNVEKNIFSLNI